MGNAPPSEKFPLRSEIALQRAVMDVLRADPERWRKIPLVNSKSDARTLFDLIGMREFGRDFDLKEEKNLVERDSILSKDLFFLERPDIVLWSKHSGQHRIVFEVKQHARPTHKEPDASQFLRYFLHLIVTSDSKPRGKKDIRRGMIAVAPTSWFENKSKSRTWRHLVEHYGPLAKQFDITLAELRAEDFYESLSL